MFHVTCSSCTFRARVKKAGKLPACPRCGGELELGEAIEAEPPELTEPAKAPEPAEAACPSCEASNPPQARYCEVCGKAMDAEAEGASVDKQERRRVNRELGKASGFLKAMRTLFIAVAAASAVMLLLMVMSLSSVAGEARRNLTAIITIFGILLALCILGASFLKRAPFVWGLALSCFMTLASLLAIPVFVVAMEIGSYLAVLTSILSLGLILMTIGAWSSTARLAKVGRLLKEHSDLISTQRILGTRQARAPASEMTTRMRENRGLRQVRTAVYSAVILAGIVVVALIGRLLTSSGPREGSSTVLAQSRPESPPYRPYIARFEEAWMRGDRTAIMSFFPELVREYQHKRFQKRLDQRGIDEDLPELTDYNEILIPRDNPQKVKAYWSIPSARIRTEWHHEDGKWVLTRLGFGRPR